MELSALSNFRVDTKEPKCLTSERHFTIAVLLSAAKKYKWISALDCYAWKLDIGDGQLPATDLYPGMVGYWR